MLSNVTWGEYAGIVVILLVVYYLVIGSMCYPSVFKDLLSGKFMKRGKTNNQDTSGNDDTSFEELEDFVKDLRYAVLERAGNSADKEELLQRLQTRLEGYSGLERPAYRVALNNYIITHAKETCGVVFTEKELNAAWDELSR